MKNKVRNRQFASSNQRVSGKDYRRKRLYMRHRSRQVIIMAARVYSRAVGLGI